VGTSVFLIDAATNKVTKTAPAEGGEEWSGGLAISNDGKLVAAQRGARMCVWTTADGKLAKSFDTVEPLHFVRLQWSPDSTQLYVCDESSFDLVAYKALTGEKGTTSACLHEETETFDEEVEVQSEDEAEDDGVMAGVDCESGHKLVMGVNQSKYQGPASCDVCKDTVPTKFAYSCAECGYDLCKKCYQEKFNGTIKDAKGHIYVLGQNATKREYASGAGCDICKKTLPASEAYSCELCNSDLCPECYAKKEEEAEGGGNADGGDADGGDAAGGDAEASGEAEGGGEAEAEGEGE